MSTHKRDRQRKLRDRYFKSIEDENARLKSGFAHLQATVFALVERAGGAFSVTDAELQAARDSLLVLNAHVADAGTTYSLVPPPTMPAPAEQAPVGQGGVLAASPEPAAAPTASESSLAMQE